MKDYIIDTYIYIYLGNGEEYFQLDSNHGLIYLAKGLDAENGTQSFELIIEASDSGLTSRTGTGTITVTVNAESDEFPSCSKCSYFAPAIPQNISQTAKVKCC